MSTGDIDTTALIISICVIIPAVIAISVCAIIYFAHRKKDRKLHRQTNSTSSYEYEHTRERSSNDAYIIDFTRANHRYQQQRRLREPPPVFEQSPPSYDTTIISTRRQPIPTYLPIRTKPLSANIHRSSPIITPSVYSAMPPSYAEIFLAPQTLPNE